MLNNIIKKIRLRPGAYLGKHSITNLRHFLNGYDMALSDSGHYNNSHKALLPLSFWYMHELAAVAYGLYESTSGWCNIILNGSDGNEAIALDNFFKLYDEFGSLRICSVKCAKLNNDNMKHCIIHGPYRSDYNMETQSHVNREPVFEKPHTVYIFTLTTDGGISFDMLITECTGRTVVNRVVFSDSGERAERGTAEEFAAKIFGELSFEQCSHMDNYSFQNDEKYFYY